MIKVSIIIVNYNTKEVTVSCLKSIYDSNIKTPFEVIVVDNASSDGSVQEFKKIRKPNLHLIESNSNLGFSKGNNLGIKKAKGEYILLLNSDTEVKSKSIDTLYEFASSSMEIGAVGPKLLNTDGSTQESAYYLPNPVRAFQSHWLGKKELTDKYVPHSKEKKPVEVEALVMAAFMITPQGLDKVGLLNEKYFMYFEDLDYCRELRKHNLKIFYLPSSEIIHHHGLSGNKLAKDDSQWKRLIPSAKIYYGTVGYYVQWVITRSAQIIGISK